MRYVERYSAEAPYILIGGWGEDDLKLIEQSIVQIKNKPIGKGLLKKIKELSTNEKFVKIVCQYRKGHSARPVLTKSQLKSFEVANVSDDPYDKNHNSLALYISSKPLSKSKREGTSALVEFDPSESISIVNGEPKFSNLYKEAFVCLAHELIHSLRFLKGNSLAGKGGDIQNPSSYAMQEENRVVGLGQYAHRTFTENAVRAEHGLLLRKTYLIPYHLQNL